MKSLISKFYLVLIMTKEIYLTIDIGNSLTKLLVFDKDKILLRKVSKSLNLRMVTQLHRKYKVTGSIICSVSRTPASVKNYLKRNTKFIELKGTTRVPALVSYKTPETLGPDRLAGIIAASKLFPGKNVLVIDMGTCIKYDFLTARNVYFGGSISPGLEMRFKALHRFTGRLPLVVAEPQKGFLGRNTKESILTGVQTGIMAELEGFIARYKKEYGTVKVIMTGGDASRFAEQLKFRIFAAPDLVSIGLNEILNFNARYH